MQELLAALNSPFGVVLGGALISGVFVQYIASRWQQSQWVFQQRFAAERLVHEKQLEQRYQLLDDISSVIADILTRSQIVVAGHQKKALGSQMDQLIQAYNDSEIKWMSMNHLYEMQLGYLFRDVKLEREWRAIKVIQEKLDVAIYLMCSSDDAAHEQQCMDLIVGISKDSAILCQRMLSAVNGPLTR